MNTLAHLWERTPALVKAPLTAFIVLQVSQLTFLGIFGNLHALPNIPWALPATLILVWLFWLYFTGHGWPRSSQEWRRRVTRQSPNVKVVDAAALAPLGFSLVAMCCFRLLMPSIMPVAPPVVSIDLATYSPSVVIGILISIVLIAAVTEEVVFRGYLQQPLEQAYGIVVALPLTGLAFWFAHIDKVTLTHLPFHIIASVMLGMLVWLTRSLWPAIIAHGLGDALLQPAYLSHQPTFVWEALTARPLWEASGVTSATERLHIVLSTMSPPHMLTPGKEQLFAVLAWAFIFFMVAATMSLLRLWRTLASTMSASLPETASPRT
jgi:membrane protease YdiL (CAAX protease family)